MICLCLEKHRYRDMFDQTALCILNLGKPENKTNTATNESICFSNTFW